MDCIKYRVWRGKICILAFLSDNFIHDFIAIKWAIEIRLDLEIQRWGFELYRKSYDNYG